MGVLRTWKKVYESDLNNIIEEMKEVVSLPAVVILSGPVGAGKTTFTKKFVGNSDEVTSPTYSVINDSGKIAHADFYRLNDPEDLIHLELDLYLEDKDYFLVEWGAPFLAELKRMVSEDFLFYELQISVNASTDSADSRNFELIQMND